MSRAGGFSRAIPCLETALAQGQAASTSLAALQSLMEDEARQPSRMIAVPRRTSDHRRPLPANPRGQARPIGNSRFFRLSRVGKGPQQSHQHSRESGSFAPFPYAGNRGQPLARGPADRRDEGVQQRMGRAGAAMGLSRERAPTYRTAPLRQVDRRPNLAGYQRRPAPHRHCRSGSRAISSRPEAMAGITRSACPQVHEHCPTRPVPRWPAQARQAPRRHLHLLGRIRRQGRRRQDQPQAPRSRRCRHRLPSLERRPPAPVHTRGTSRRTRRSATRRIRSAVNHCWGCPCCYWCLSIRS